MPEQADRQPQRVDRVPRRHTFFASRDHQHSRSPDSRQDAVNLSGRLRAVSLALLLAMLLITPMIDCALHGDDEHTHPGGGAVHVVAIGSEAHHLHGPGAHLRDHCDQHMIHCIGKAVLPAVGAAVAPLPGPTLIAAVALVALALVFTGSCGTRGPPGVLPVSNGQDILTKFCIARR